LRAGAVEREVRLIDELNLDGVNIGVYRQHIFGEISIEETAKTRIDLARLTQRRPNSPDHAAAHLALSRPRTNHPAAIGNTDHARHSDTPRITLNPHFHEMRDIAEGDVIGIDRAADGGQARAQPHEDGVRLPRRLALHLDLERAPAGGL